MEGRSRRLDWTPEVNSKGQAKNVVRQTALTNRYVLIPLMKANGYEAVGQKRIDIDAQVEGIIVDQINGFMVWAQEAYGLDFGRVTEAVGFEDFGAATGHVDLDPLVAE